MDYEILRRELRLYCRQLASTVGFSISQRENTYQTEILRHIDPKIVQGHSLKY